ncbi:hypothetical protein DFH06DRAFT_1126072 [Mycena polygramma]|nr:hypothetical protein DFH06DRAFT_1126072 [Mycena polygramma]
MTSTSTSTKSRAPEKSPGNMSPRLTSTQIIDQGDYLNPDFDPSSLTVAQLHGVLTYHEIRYTPPYTKFRLINVFNIELKARADILSRERLESANVAASDKGIVDGLTGMAIGTRKKRGRKGTSKGISKAPRKRSEK